jgi:hypothetical protein
MLLIGTNVFLELILGQKKADECEGSWRGFLMESLKQ